MNELEPITPTPELLRPTEVVFEGHESLTAEAVEEIFHYRRSILESLRPQISLKFLHWLEEKINGEQGQAQRLLKLENKKQEILEDYSFILKEEYFEQKLFN